MKLNIALILLFNTVWANSSSACSENYGKKIVGDDGRISLVDPYFLTPNNSKARISGEQTDLNGLCKLYCLGNAVTAGTISHLVAEFDDPVTHVYINNDGKFSGYNFGERANFKWFYSDIEVLMCEPN